MASKRAIRRKACTGKRRYGTQADARRAISQLTRARGWQGLLVPYRCKFCGGFHFGHPPAHVRKAIRAA